MHWVFISSEKLGVWDLCVHLVLNVCLFCFWLLLFASLSFYFPILLPYFSSLHFSVSCSCVSCYRLRGVVWIWLALSSLHFPFILLWLIPPFIPPCEIELSLSAWYQDLSFCFNLLVWLFPFLISTRVQQGQERMHSTIWELNTSPSTLSTNCWRWIFTRIWGLSP